MSLVRAETELFFLKRGAVNFVNKQDWTGHYTTQHWAGVITLSQGRNRLKQLPKQVPYVWPVGLVAWFSLWVREVPGSTPGQALFVLICPNILQAVTVSTCFNFFLIYWLFECKELKDRKKEVNQRQEAKKILYSQAKAWACVELWNSPFNLFTMYKVFFERYPGNILF